MHSANAAIRRRSLNVSRSVGHATATPAASADRAAATSAAPPARAVAAVIAPISIPTSRTAAVAGETVARLLPTSPSPASVGFARTTASPALKTAATGDVPTWIPIPTTAAPAATCALLRHLTAAGGFAVSRRAAAIARRGGAAGMDVAGHAPAPTGGTATPTGVTPDDPDSPYYPNC